MPTWINRYAHLETQISANSYYANRVNVTKNGTVYSKLVKADRSPTLFRGRK
jgi:hypothetical protein